MNNKQDITLDILYNAKVKYFQNKYVNIIPKVNKQIEELKDTLTPTNETEINIKIKELEKKIQVITNEKNKYYLENSKYLFEYFESKQNIDKNNTPKKTINSFFNVKEKEERMESMNKCIQQYLKKNNFDTLNINDYIYNKSICPHCNKGELIKVNHDGVVLCNACFITQEYLVDNDKPSYKEPPKEISFYAYKRINHFREVLSQVQAKESTEIPKEVIENLKNQIKKERIDISELTNKKTKELLKKLSYNKYYEHIPFIKDKLGIKPPVMTPQLEETLCNLFMDIQIPYSKFCPNDRVNFLNYYYTLYKLCELLGENQFLQYFPMLKDQKKIEQDEIWKKICGELSWQFIPTI